MGAPHANDADFRTPLSTWRQLTTTALHSARAANRAMLAPIKAGTAATRAVVDADGDGASIPSLAYEEDHWAFERTVDDPEHITVGDRVVFTKRIDDADITAFAQVSGDTSRLHLDATYARQTRFGERIAHGTLVSGMISAALARLPGLTIYLSQDLEFLAPVGIGSTLVATVEVVEDLGSGQYRLSTAIEDKDDGERVVDGEAIVLVDPVEA